MLLTLYIIAVVWALLLCIEIAFKNRLHLLGITIKPLYARWRLTNYNFIWARLGTQIGPILDTWFHVGFVFTLAVIPVAIVLLINNFYNHTIGRNDEGKTEVFQPVLPGVNIPINELGYYIGALLIASIVHEAGHALAAVRTNLRVDGVGLMVFAIVPAAFVELPTDLFNELNPKDKLKVVCAGVWHNFVLAALCGLLLVANPIILSPFFTTPDGVVVASINHGDIGQAGGLQVGQVITAVGGCRVHSKETWKSCLGDAMRKPVLGYCVESSFVDENRFHSLEPDKCCGGDSRRMLCFEEQGAFPPSVDGSKSCLPVRPLLQNYLGNCNFSSDCKASKSGNLRCLKPTVDNQLMRLMQLKRSDEEDFLFFGYPSEIYGTIFVNSYLARISWIPGSIVYYEELFLRYIASFSLALGVLNAVPCYMLDGHWIAAAFVEAILRRHMEARKRQILSKVLSLLGSGLVLSAVVFAGRQLLNLA